MEDTEVAPEAFIHGVLGLNQSIPSIAFTLTPLATAYMLTRMGWRPTLDILSVPALLLSLFILLFIRG